MVGRYILAFGYSGIKYSIFSIFISLYGNENHFTTRIPLDPPEPLLFPADDRVWVTTWVNAQTL